MAVFYRLYQNGQKGTEQYKLWYGRAVMTNKVTIDDLAAEIEANCTVKRADILAVISELVVTMKKELQNSKKVHLDGFGTFRIGLRTKPVANKEDFNVAHNLKDVHMLFRPELHIDATGRRIKSFLDGCKVMQLPKVEKKEVAAGGEQTEG